MRLLESAARWELMILVVSFAAVTSWKLFSTGRMTGLLRSSDGTLSPGRIQMLVLTVLTALQYLLKTMHDPTHLPTIPMNLVMALGGSHAVYLGSKAWTLLGSQPERPRRK